MLFAMAYQIWNKALVFGFIIVLLLYSLRWGAAGRRDYMHAIKSLKIPSTHAALR